MDWCVIFILLTIVSIAVALHPANVATTNEHSEYEGKLVKGNRNAVYLIQKGFRKQFPDFYTFHKMGYDAEKTQKIPDDILNAIPMGETFPSIPVFRPEDYMYHAQCEDADR